MTALEEVKVADREAELEAMDETQKGMRVAACGSRLVIYCLLLAVCYLLLAA